MIKKLKSILQGWSNDKKSKRGELSEELDELFSQRLSVCRSNKCGQLSKFGICKACGCPVRKKTKSLLESCPLNEWKPITYDKDGILVIMASEISPKLREVYYADYDDYDPIPLTEWELFLSTLQEK